MLASHRHFFSRTTVKVILWLAIVCPLAGAFSGTAIAYATLFSVSADPLFAALHGAPLGLLFGVVYGAAATPFVLPLGLFKGAGILMIGTMAGGLFPALAGHAPFALLLSLSGGAVSLVLLVHLWGLDRTRQRLSAESGKSDWN